MTWPSPRGLPKIDLHVHSTFSDGDSTLHDIASSLRTKGLAALGVSDHYVSNSAPRGRMGRSKVKEYLSQASSLGLLKGVEVDIYEDGGVSIAPSERWLFDYIIGGVHRLGGIDFWRDPSSIPRPGRFMEALREAIVGAIESGHIDVVAHLTWLPEDLRGAEGDLITDSWVGSIVRAAASRGVAIEVNGMWKVPGERVVERCLKEGVKLSMGSDAHRAGDVGDLSYPLGLLGRLGASVEDLFIPRCLEKLRKG
ncbi:MAG: PHP domain-containing protein [Candidatus Nezhaarchaeota archaeon]|nr:PHP domain-containing protein [Candidatus Nezhaarchaeota archaeon]